MFDMMIAADAFEDVDLLDLPVLPAPAPNLLDELFAAERLRAARRKNRAIDAGLAIAAQKLIHRRAVATADILLPDGAGVAVALRERGRRAVETLRGEQFFPQLCRRSAMRELTVYFLGGLPGAAEALADAAEVMAPGLVVAGFHDGCFPAEESEDVVDEINLSGADILIIGFGAPRGEASAESAPDGADRGQEPSIEASASGGGAKQPPAMVIEFAGRRPEKRDPGRLGRTFHKSPAIEPVPPLELSVPAFRATPRADRPVGWRAAA